MLAYILAVFVGTGSVGLYIAAFFFPELHRKQDFIWSGVGCFYALTLWIYAREVTGGILVGQVASVALIGWFAWQILNLRRQLSPIERQTPIPNPTQLQPKLGLNKSRNVSAGEANPTAVKQPEPNASPSDRSTTPNPNSSSIHIKRAQAALAKQRANSVEIDVSQHQQSAPPPKVVIKPTGENDNEAWIKLEVKTSPAKSPETQPPQSITSQPPTETANPQPPQSIISPAKSPESQPSQSIITSQPPAETTKPPSSSPAPPAIAKTDLPVGKDRQPASKAEPSAQNHLNDPNNPIDVTPAKNDPIDVTPIKSNLEDEANWE